MRTQKTFWPQRGLRQQSENKGHCTRKMMTHNEKGSRMTVDTFKKKSARSKQDISISWKPLPTERMHTFI
jgi:hypothetical protein